MLNEKEWVERYLNGSTWGWGELLKSGRVKLHDLTPGPLHSLLDTYLTIEFDLEAKLDELGYDPG